MRDELNAGGRSELADEGFALDGLRTETLLEMRYAGQSYELSVPVESLEPGEFLPLFHAAHRERYGHAEESRAVEVVTMRVRLVMGGSEVGNRRSEVRGRKASPAHSATREVCFGGEALETAVYERPALAAGHRFVGPAIVVQMDSTTVVPPGWRAAVDSGGNLLLEQAF
jgi:N-methylhydantoinase A